MQINVQITGLEKVAAQLKKLSDTEIKQATAKAINDGAAKVRTAMMDEMGKVFDRPTPYILRSVRYTQATPEKLESTISPTYMGGKGVDPQKVLAAEVAGGPRRDKRSEVLLRKAGILPNGYFTRIPTDPFPGSDDGRGNLRGPFIVQLISYFQAFGEQGFRANMSDRRMKKMHNIGASANGYKTINGVMYFVSYGKLRSGSTSHLGAGIWAKSGIHGSNVRPVLMFIKSANYTPRLVMEKIVSASKINDYVSSRLRFRIRQAVEALGLDAK